MTSGAKACASQSLLTADTAVAALIICEICALEDSILGTRVNKQAAQGHLALLSPSTVLFLIYSSYFFRLIIEYYHTRHVLRGLAALRRQQLVRRRRHPPRPQQPAPLLLSSVRLWLRLQLQQDGGRSVGASFFLSSQSHSTEYRPTPLCCCLSSLLFCPRPLLLSSLTPSWLLLLYGRYDSGVKKLESSPFPDPGFSCPSSYATTFLWSSSMSTHKVRIEQSNWTNNWRKESQLNKSNQEGCS